MNLISCTDPCIYQQEGYCTLARAASTGESALLRDCIHYLPRNPSQKHCQGLTNVFHRDQL